MARRGTSGAVRNTAEDAAGSATSKVMRIDGKNGAISYMASTRSGTKSTGTRTRNYGSISDQNTPTSKSPVDGSGSP